MINNYEYYSPYTRETINEEMYFGQTIHYLYGQPIGRLLLLFVFKRIWWGIIYRLYKKSRFSKKSISRDIKRFNLNMNEYKVENWISYNHFFMRRFKNDARAFIGDERTLNAFAEGKYLVYDSKDSSTITIKGERLEINELFKSKNYNLSDSYLVVARLCPTDYHHYHFPCEGSVLETYLVRGAYDSVNIFAQAYRPSILFKNKRWVTFLETTFGKIAYVEVGGMSVATIVNHHKSGDKFNKGDHKGHFEYGGSSIILVVPKEKIKLRSDLLEHSAAGRETYLKLGDTLGVISN